MKDIITVAVVNFKVYGGKKERNLSRMCEYAECAARRGADLILFPEMSLNGFDYYIDDRISLEDKRSTAETVDGPACRTMAETAKKYGIYIVFGMAGRMVCWAPIGKCIRLRKKTDTFRKVICRLCSKRPGGRFPSGFALTHINSLNCRDTIVHRVHACT